MPTPMLSAPPPFLTNWVKIASALVGLLQPFFAFLMSRLRDRTLIAREGRALERATKRVDSYNAWLDMKQRFSTPDEMKTALEEARADLEGTWQEVRDLLGPKPQMPPVRRSFLRHTFLLWQPKGGPAWVAHAVFYCAVTAWLLGTIGSLLDEEANHLSRRAFFSGLPDLIQASLVLLGIIICTHTLATFVRLRQETTLFNETRALPPPVIAPGRPVEQSPALAPAITTSLSETRRSSLPRFRWRRLAFGAAVMVSGVAMELFWDPTEAYNLGIDSFNDGDYQKAAVQFSDAISVYPYDPDAYGSRADAYFELGRYDQAIADYSRAIRLAGDASDLHSGRGRAYAAKRELDHAIQEYNEALKIRPKDAQTLFYRCEAYEAAGKDSYGLADCTRAVELDPGLSEAGRLRDRIKERLTAGNLR